MIVVGHTGCGGVKHCVEEVLGQQGAKPTTESLHHWLAALTKLARDNHSSSHPITVPVLVKKNVELQVENLKNMQVVKDSKVQVHGWIYNLSTGVLNHELDK